MVGSGSSTGQITLLDASGKTLWQTNSGYATQAIAAADIDEDGQLDFIAGTSNGDLLILDMRGALRGRVTFPAPVTHLRVTNLDDTPRPELLAVAGPTIYLLDAVLTTTIAELPPTPDPAQPIAGPTDRKSVV